MYRIHVSTATDKTYIAQMKLEKIRQKPFNRLNVVNGLNVNLGRIPYLTMNICSVSLSANVGTANVHVYCTVHCFLITVLMILALQEFYGRSLLG